MGNKTIAKKAVAQHKHRLKAAFANIASIGEEVHDMNDRQSHVVSIYLKDDSTEGLPKMLEVQMPNGQTKSVNTEIIKNVGKGSIHINQENEVSSVAQCKGSVCCLASTPTLSHAIITSGHVCSNGKSTNLGGNITGGENVLVNSNITGQWVFQVINFKTDVAAASITNFVNDSAYKSFSGKAHYTVGDADVKNTKVTLISNVNHTRSGFILGYNQVWDVDYDDGVFQKSKIILIGSTSDRDTSVTLSQKGDSGGCVFEPVSGNLVGLILGGNEKFTWVLSLQEIFTKNNFNLL